MRLKSAYSIEVYRSDAGYICIKQDAEPGIEEMCVMLVPEQAMRLCQEIGRLIQESDGWSWADDENTEEAEE